MKKSILSQIFEYFFIFFFQKRHQNKPLDLPENKLNIFTKGVKIEECLQKFPRWGRSENPKCEDYGGNPRIKEIQNVDCWILASGGSIAQFSRAIQPKTAPKALFYKNFSVFAKKHFWTHYSPTMQ